MTDPPSSDGEPILAGRSIQKRYGRLLVLDSVEFAMEAGSAVGIVGPNGAGKTTLLDVLVGAQTPTAGSVHFRGADVTAFDVRPIAAGWASAGPTRCPGHSRT